MILRNDMLPDGAPRGIEVIQITDEPDVPGTHVYMEAQIFTPDSKRFVLHRSAHPHGSDKNDPEHRYLVCDIENDCELSPVTDELGVTAPSISPDGETLYYFVNETETGGGRLTLKSVGLDGTARRTVLVLDEGFPGTDYHPSRIYPLSTISSDGMRLAGAGFLADAFVPGAAFGLYVFDLEDATGHVAVEGPTWCNLHPQYCRSRDTDACHDIMIQENHGNEINADGKIVNLTGGTGADIHVVRDDGADMRSFPWGRDGNEFCQGHQCWRGRSTWAITSTGTRDVDEQQLIEGAPVPFAGHIGLETPGGVRNDLSRDFEGKPEFAHFATDEAGEVFISDYGRGEQSRTVYLGRLGAPGEDPVSDWVCLADSGCRGQKVAHLHPFLSPDGTKAFFNSDESGILQAYMIRGLENLR